MSDLGVSLSDLETARTLSQRLTGRMAEDAASSAPSGYVRFDSSRFAAVTTTVTAPPQPAESPIQMLELESWDHVLRFIVERSAARAAFVVEPEGFVISTAGDWSFEHLEGVGPQLSALFEKASQIEDGSLARTIAIQFDSYWLTGLSFVQEGMGTFIVGLLGPAPLDDQLRNALSEQVRHSLYRL